MAHSVHDPVMLRHTLHLHNTIPQARVALAGNTSHCYNHTSHKYNLANTALHSILYNGNSSAPVMSS